MDQDSIERLAIDAIAHALSEDISDWNQNGYGEYQMRDGTKALLSARPENKKPQR